MSSINNIIKKLRENRILNERKDYEEYSTIELVTLAQEGDQLAIETLISRYSDHIKNMTSKYFFDYGDEDDVLQTATIGFWEAIMSWNKSGNFESYSGMIMKRKLIDAINKAEAGKVQVNKNAQSMSDTINSDGEGGEQTLGDIIPDKGDTPEDAAIASELRDAIEEYIEKNYKPHEREVLQKSVEGYSKKEIAEEMGLTYKQVDNIIYKMKYWLKNYIKEHFSESRRIRREKDIEFSDEEKKILSEALTNIRKRESAKVKASPLKEAYENYTTAQIEDELDDLENYLDTIQRSLSYYSRDHIQEELEGISYKALAIGELGLEESDVTDEQSNRAYELSRRAEEVFNEYDARYTRAEV